MADNDNGSNLLWFVAGAAIGASVAILFAPASGEEVRGHIARKTGEGRAAIAATGQDMMDRSKELLDRAKKLTDQATQMFDQGRKLVENTAANLQNG